MNKHLTLLAAAALVAGTVFAQDESGPASAPPPGPQPSWSRAGGPPGRNQMERRPGPGVAGPMAPEMLEQMRAEHKAIRDLGEAARAATNETQKAELVAQLRTKLGEVADRMQAHQEQRLAQAEQQLAGLKERIEYARTNRDKMLDEQVQRILSGEHPGRPGAFDKFPHAKGGQPGGADRAGENWRGKRGRGPGPGEGLVPPPPPAEDAGMAPPPAGDEGMAPPPEEDMPGDLPPPAENEMISPPPEE